MSDGLKLGPKMGEKEKPTSPRPKPPARILKREEKAHDLLKECREMLKKWREGPLIATLNYDDGIETDKLISRINAVVGDDE